MIEHPWELRILIKEEPLGRTVNTRSTIEFNDISYFYSTTYEGCEVTAIRMIDNEVILVDLKYDDFKKKYNTRKEEILAAMGNRP